MRMGRRNQEIDKAEEIRAATREANETLKDLRIAMKQAQGLIEDIAMEAEREIDEHVDPAVRKGLEEYKASVDKAITEATEAVFGRFDKLFDLMMNPKEIPSLTEIIERVVRPKVGDDVVVEKKDDPLGKVRAATRQVHNPVRSGFPPQVKGTHPAREDGDVPPVR